MELLDLRVGITFKMFEDAKIAVSNFCCKHHHPIRCDKKESISSYNRRAADDWKVTTLPENDIFSYRYVQGHA